MEPDGPKTSSNPKAVLASLMSKREKLQDNLRNIEKQVYDMETSYLQDSSHFVNALKGFEGFLSSTKTTSLKRTRKFQPEDRLFSLSSVTSPVVEEQEAGRDDFGQVRSRGRGMPANGQGRPKRGRITPRDVKRSTPLSEQNADDEDDPDPGLR